MANILGYIRRLFAPRHHQRFMVQNDTIVILSPGTDNEQNAHVIDISEGGVAFVYHGSKEDLETSGILNMLTKNASLEKVNFETVSDKPATGSYRRRGVKFDWMGVLKQNDLKDFIKSIRI